MYKRQEKGMMRLSGRALIEQRTEECEEAARFAGKCLEKHYEEMCIRDRCKGSVDG